MHFSHRRSSGFRTVTEQVPGRAWAARVKAHVTEPEVAQVKAQAKVSVPVTAEIATAAASDN
jgi:hypothetical protein